MNVLYDRVHNLMSFRSDDLICPDCHIALQCDVKNGRGTLVCTAGHGPWLVEDGIARFVEGDIPHDSRWTTSYREQRGWGPLGWLLRRNIHWGIPHLLRPMLARLGRYPLEIVDLGCGGGWEFLTEFGRVTGVDYGAGALQSAASIYNRVIRSQVERLPLSDRSVDAVVSIWMFEHLTERQFVAALREIKRVLRPGGRLIFFVDLDSSKPIIRWAKCFPEEYTRHHIDAVGHYGLRSLRYTKFLLQHEGFVENETITVNKSSLLQPVTALWMFNNELGHRSRILSLYLLLCRLVLRSRFLYRPLYLLLMEYHRLADRRLPETYAFSAAFDWILPETRVASFPMVVRSNASDGDKNRIDLWCGLPVDEENRGRRPVAVMVDNSSRSHPQLGLAGASLIIEAPVEGGLTRLMPVFTRIFSDRVGPVRSARPYFIEWAGAYQPFYVHCGGSPESRTLLEHPERVIDIEYRYHIGASGEPEVLQNAQILATEDGRTPPHNIFIVPERIFGQLDKLTIISPIGLEQSTAAGINLIAHYCPGLSTIFRDEAIRDDEGTARVRIEVHSRPRAPYPERFEWDGLAGGFRRTVLNTPVGEDATGDPNLLIANLVLIWVRVTNIPGDIQGRLRIDTYGEGPAQIWCGPRSEGATWYRIHGSDPIQFRDLFGRPFLLRRGLTWIYALPEEAIVKITRP